ncbi:RabGAP/TBC [Phialemonium atrogriseum]|uniref:RabGAP/TBC n=1 Tax=Phialemonium atrogriseum TaxID=1093897 RepID=A0AAJ0C4M9_9PEZI|nr:RabGAP/TBC [Phialemonium atrogriseum]KAK1768622.1 RabGAP/TBC [Phialemonium atrogriseum]
MRPLSETKSRWEETLKHSSSFVSLQRAIKFNGLESPCLSGCRSVCWKTFLLFQDSAQSDWSHILLEARNNYSSLRDQYLKYIKHPEKLSDLSLDPLADVPDSPWDAVRRDELLRGEILQDVQRLPDDPFYHQEKIQEMILDILFIYCKLNPSAGGYRQGMHELLAPLVFVVDQDAIDRDAAPSDGVVDPSMVEMLDSYFVEHDAFALFSKIMDRAGTFYDVGRASGSHASEQNIIVEKSQHIHEVVLMKLDPELANHLKNIEVLPQIFLIRWIRLLFGREFPFEQLLVLWDTLFAFDPSLSLIDLICVAMLIRIRWTLLEADYSVALQLLLKYPSPSQPHGPHTFVDDALYLRDHLNAAGGSTLILKYTGKTPATLPSPSSRPSTPTFQGFTLRSRTLGAKSPLSNPARLLQHPGGVEAIFQGAAKGVIERGEKLGINQAVRDAMGEIRRNMQGFNDPRNLARPGRGSPADDGPMPAAVAVLERRNRQLAAMLGETLTDLETMAASKLDGDRDRYVEMIEAAATKIQFVKLRLQDPSLALPGDELPAIGTLSLSPRAERRRSPTVALDTTPVVMTSSAAESVRSALASPDFSGRYDGPPHPPTAPGGDTDPSPRLPSPTPRPPELSAEDVDRMDTDLPAPQPAPKPSTEPVTTTTTNRPGPPPPEKPPRPAPGPTPSRSTIAQSSFSWMLEPEAASPFPSTSNPTSTTASSSSSPLRPSSARLPLPADGAATPNSGGRRRRRAPGSADASRERNAFLFGEVGPGGSESGSVADEVFGMLPMGKGRGRGRG